MSLVDASEMMRDDVFYGSFNGTESSFFNRAKARLAPEQLDTEPVRPTITFGFGRWTVAWLCSRVLTRSIAVASITSGSVTSSGSCGTRRPARRG